MFENHTGSSRTVASSWLLPGLGGREPGRPGFRGQGTDRSTKTWNHLQTMPEGIDQALAKSGQFPADLSQLKTCHGHLHPYYKYPI